MRDRAQELLDEEAALADALASTWGAEGRTDLPRLSLPFDRLLAHTAAGATNVLSAPEGPDTPMLAATGFDPVVGDADGLATRLRSLRDSGFRVVLAAEGSGSADRLGEIVAGDGIDAVAAPDHGRARARHRRHRRRAARARHRGAGRAARARRRRSTSPAGAACTAGRAARSAASTSTRT